MLDTSVAGGVRADESPFENIIHEAEEEASIPEDVIKKGVKPVGAITMMGIGKGSGKDAGDGLVGAQLLYVFDLQLEEGFELKPGDDEVEAFYLMSVEEVKSAMLRSEFKDNSAVVMMDFFIRHGLITSDNEKDYAELGIRSHRKLPFPLGPE
jgi:hypothetical protein